jgi:hypothetical protein
MKKATKEDKNHVVKIICEAFYHNPHVSFIVKNDEKKPERMKALAEYAFDLGMRREAVFLTDDRLGVSIIYRYGEVKMGLKEYLRQIKLIFSTFSWERGWKIYQLEKEIWAKRSQDTPYLYLWFFGVADEALGTNNARDMMRFIFQMSADQQLPMVLETSAKRNQVIYKRYGFVEYDCFETGRDQLTMWYMRRPWQHPIP